MRRTIVRPLLMRAEHLSQIRESNSCYREGMLDNPPSGDFAQHQADLVFFFGRSRPRCQA